MDRSYLAVGAALGAIWFGACQVYTPEDLVGNGQGGGDSQTGGAASGGSAGDSAGGTGGSSGDTASGGNGGTSGSATEGGSAGDAPAGGKGGGTTGGSSSGGSDSGGSSTGGSSIGGSMTGGSSGSGSGGKGGSAGAAAGMAGMSGGVAGTGGAGGAAAGAGGAGTSGGGNGGAGNGGKAGGGAGGSVSGAGGSGGGTVVLLPGTASADSSQTNPAHPPSDGNDGVTTTRWCAANAAAGHYWTVDLGAVHTLSRFEVMWEYPSQAIGLAYGYVISTSTDGTTFTPVIDRSANTDTTQTQSSNFPASTSARHVRITVSVLPPSSLATWASFYEARVYGQ